MTINVRDSSKVLSILTLVANIATIIALLIAIVSYWDYKAIQRSNDNIILSNAQVESAFNLAFASDLLEGRQRYLQTYQFTANRFQTFYLEKSLDIVDNEVTRQRIFRLAQGMEGSNRLMDLALQTSLLVSASPNLSLEQLDTRNQQVSTILDFVNNNIKPELEHFENEGLLNTTN